MLEWLPRWFSGKKSACQYRRCRRCDFNSWIRNVPWSRKWQPTSIFLPGKSHGQRILEGCSPMGPKELDMTEWLSVHTHTHTQTYNWKFRLFSIFHNCKWCWKEQFIVMYLHINKIISLKPANVMFELKGMNNLNDFVLHLWRTFRGTQSSVATPALWLDLIECLKTYGQRFMTLYRRW